MYLSVVCTFVIRILIISHISEDNYIIIMNLEMNSFSFSNLDYDSYFSPSESGHSSTLSSNISSCESDCESIASSLCSSSTNENPIEDVRFPDHIRPYSSKNSELNHINTVSGDICYTLISESDYYNCIIPPHKTVDKGLTFQVNCHNKCCKLFNKKFVNIHLGMCIESNQVCHFAEYMFEVYCPVCCSQILPKNIYKLILKDCCVKIKYKKYDEVCKEYSMSVRDNYLLIKVNDTDKFDYFKLTLC